MVHESSIPSPFGDIPGVDTEIPTKGGIVSTVIHTSFERAGYLPSTFKTHTYLPSTTTAFFSSVPSHSRTAGIISSPDNVFIGTPKSFFISSVHFFIFPVSIVIINLVFS